MTDGPRRRAPLLEAERLLGAALGGALVFAGFQAAHRMLDDDPAPADPIVLQVPLVIDGHHAGTCELEITATTMSDLRCEDITVPTTTEPG